MQQLEHVRYPEEAGISSQGILNYIAAREEAGLEHHAIWVRPPQADLSTEPPGARALPSARSWGRVTGTFTRRSQRPPTKLFHMWASANWKDVGMFILD